MELTRIKIVNVKGVRDFDATLGHRTTISGANATGKSTIFDAFLWNLFGKDAQDRTDSGRGAFGLKTVDENGNVIEKLDHEVTIWLKNDDGQTLELTRRLTEKWVKKARAKEPVFEGNTTTCIWNGAEIGVNEWNKRIEEHIMPVRMFKMLTNPHYFSSLPWQEQLTELTRMIGNVTPDDIAETNPAFKAVLDGLGQGNTIKDRLTTIATEHRRLKKRLDEIPSEIKGINAATPEAPEYGELECEQNALLQEEERIDEAMRNIAEAERQHFENLKAKQEELHKIESQQFTIYSNALATANDNAVKANAAYNEAEATVRINQQNVDSITREMQDNNRREAQELEAKQEDINRLTNQRESLYKQWDDIDAREYAGGQQLICPLLGTFCDSANANAHHSQNIEKAKQAFNEQKNRDLDNVEEQGKRVAEQIETATADLETIKNSHATKAADLQSRLTLATQQLEAAKKVLAGMSKVQPVTSIDKKTIPEWMELHTKAEALRAEIQTLEGSEGQTLDTERTQRKKEIRTRLDQIAAELAKEKLIATNTEKVAKLEEEMSSVTQQMADLEQEEDTIKAIEKAVVDEVERRANAKFKLVKFHTCDWQINGEPVQTCYATLNGVKYTDLNSAGQVNAGLDIINTLCHEYGMTAPIFIDNAEGVNTLLATDSQLIRLQVTTDKQLNVTIEEA